MDKLRLALEQLDEALDRLDDAVTALPVPKNANVNIDFERKEMVRRLDQVIVDVQGFLDLGPNLDRAA